MASGATPHFHNSMGIPTIEVGAREFMCMGALPPFDHPHIFIDMGADTEAICPYCATRYVFNASLPAGEAKPAAAVWHDEAA